MKKIFTLVSALFVVAALNAQQADYALIGFYDAATEQVITTLNLGMNEDLNPSVILSNNGPDVAAATDTLFLDVSVNGTGLGAMYMLGSQLAAYTAGTSVSLSSQQPLLTAADLNQYGIEGTFELCYTLRLVGAATDPDASNNTACVTITRGVGIENLAMEAVSVYPNPATSVINVANAQGAQISVYDMSGRMISNIENADDNQTISTEGMAKGMYLVRIADGKNVITKKISVVR